MVISPPTQSRFLAIAQNEGYRPADFDRLDDLSGDGQFREEVDKNTVLEAMPDFTGFLPHE